MGTDIKYTFKRKGKKRVCDICGKICEPGGIGGHMRLKHGIKVKTVIRDVSDKVSDVSGQVRDKGDVPGQIRDELGSRHVREQRPSDYVKKRSEVAETRIEPVFNKSPDSMGRMLCKNCGCWFMPESWFEMKGYSNPYPYCTNGKKHELI